MEGNTSCANGNEENYQYNFVLIFLMMCNMEWMFSVLVVEGRMRLFPADAAVYKWGL